jgi:cytidylate kinase
LIVTIDGPAASGKSTVARLLAERLGASFLDTGAMYRAVTLAAMQAGVNMSDEQMLLEVLDKRKFQFIIKKNGSTGSPSRAESRDKMMVSIDGVDVTDQIRGLEVTANTQHIAEVPKMREKLVEMQRQFAVGKDKIVTEGRDQGTVAFPNADIKFYLTAQTIKRARRRAKDEGRITKDDLEQIQRAIEKRDKSDQNRPVGPLKAASDAVVIDTTDLTVEEVVARMLSVISGQLRWRMEDGGGKTDAFRPSSIAHRPSSFRWFRLARWFCKIFCMAFFRLRPAGLENVPDQGALVLICNHQSFLDPVLCGIFVKRPLYFLARDSLFRGFFGRLIASVNTIPVKRGAADLSAMKTIISKLKEGSGVCLFPEATRTSDGRITPFKPGFGLLCRRGGAAVVPVVIDGAFEVWPRHRKLFTPGGHIAIHYGKCIQASEVKKMDDRELAKLLTDTLRQMQNDCRVKQGKEPYSYG